MRQDSKGMPQGQLILSGDDSLDKTWDVSVQFQFQWWFIWSFHHNTVIFSLYSKSFQMSWTACALLDQSTRLKLKFNFSFVYCLKISQNLVRYPKYFRTFLLVGLSPDRAVNFFGYSGKDCKILQISHKPDTCVQITNSPTIQKPDTEKSSFRVFPVFRCL